jgi:predicted dehydrogenase
VSGMKPVRCAVVGLGMIGQEHAAVLAASPLADLLACCDIDTEAARRAPAGVPVTEHFGELLDLPELEAVFVCTPQETHRHVATRALRRGLFVFCEKPVAHTLTDADTLIAEPEAQAGRLVIGHTPPTTWPSARRLAAVPSAASYPWRPAGAFPTSRASCSPAGPTSPSRWASTT